MKQMKKMMKKKLLVQLIAAGIFGSSFSQACAAEEELVDDVAAMAVSDEYKQKYREKTGHDFPDMPKEVHKEGTLVMGGGDKKARHGRASSRRQPGRQLQPECS